MGFERYNNATVGDKYRAEAATGFADLLQSNGQDLDAYRRIFHGTINANLNPRANEPLDFSNPYPQEELSNGMQAQNQCSDSDGGIRYQKKVKAAYMQNQEGMNESGGNGANAHSGEGDFNNNASLYANANGADASFDSDNIRRDKKEKSAFLDKISGSDNAYDSDPGDRSDDSGGDCFDGIALGAGVSGAIDQPSSLAEAAMYPASYVME